MKDKMVSIRTSICSLCRSHHMAYFNNKVIIRSQSMFYQLFAIRSQSMFYQLFAKHLGTAGQD